MSLIAEISVGMANLLSEPRQQSELQSQYLLGEKTEVINEVSSYYEVKTEDNLSGWLHKGSVITRDRKKDEEKDLSGQKLICISPISILRKKDHESSDGILQVFLGTIILLDEPLTNYYLKNHGWLRAKLPDNSYAFLNKKDFLVYSNYKERYYGKRETAVAIAKKLLGVPYLWGGTTSSALDCSGFTQLSFRMAGKKLPRNSYQQAETGESIDLGNDLESAEPADLIFFSEGSNKISHVGIIIEEARFIHASLTYGKVVMTSLRKKDSEYNKFFRDIYRFICRHEWLDNV